MSNEKDEATEVVKTVDKELSHKEQVKQCLDELYKLLTKE